MMVAAVARAGRAGDPLVPAHTAAAAGHQRLYARAFRPAVEALVEQLEEILPALGAHRTCAAGSGALVKEGVPQDLAWRVASLHDLAAACDVWTHRPAQPAGRSRRWDGSTSWSATASASSGCASSAEPADRRRPLAEGGDHGRGRRPLRATRAT